MNNVANMSLQAPIVLCTLSDSDTVSLFVYTLSASTYTSLHFFDLYTVKGIF